MLAYGSGTSMAALARNYCVKRETISHLLRRSGIPLRQPRVLDKAGSREASKLYDQGWSLARIGDHLGFDPETIRQHLKRHGVVMRSPNQPR
jgi:lambda repressor-like predicted transcriptional regulator